MTEIKTAHERCKEAVLSELIAMGATADKPTRRAFDELVSDIIQRKGFQNDLQNVAFVGVSQGAIMALDAVASGRWKVGALVSFAGPAGSLGLAMQSCYVPCRAKAIHKITPRAKASSAV